MKRYLLQVIGQMLRLGQEKAKLMVKSGFEVDEYATNC
jgi:hypothetical protein